MHQKLFQKKLTEKPVTLTAEKKHLVIILPFLGKLSLDLRTCLKSSISENLPFRKLRLIFKPATHISSFFQLKDKIPHYIVYKFSCGICNVIYYGEICTHLSVRVGEHLGVAPLTGKKSLQQ